MRTLYTIGYHVLIFLAASHVVGASALLDSHGKYLARDISSHHLVPRGDKRKPSTSPGPSSDPKRTRTRPSENPTQPSSRAQSPTLNTSARQSPRLPSPAASRSRSPSSSISRSQSLEGITQMTTRVKGEGIIKEGPNARGGIRTSYGRKVKVEDRNPRTLTTHVHTTKSASVKAKGTHVMGEINTHGGQGGVIHTKGRDGSMTYRVGPNDRVVMEARGKQRGLNTEQAKLKIKLDRGGKIDAESHWKHLTSSSSGASSDSPGDEVTSN